MKFLSKVAVPIVLLALTSLAAAQQRPKLLPESFAGWEQSGAVRTGDDPSTVDQAHPKVLKEYGFTYFEQANYTRPDRKLMVKAARFQDATGAYGAFTFYREPNMQDEKVGTKAASANEHVMFFRDNVLVEAVFDRVTAMSASELRELAALLPTAKGNAANLPTLPNYLPREQLITNSAKYLVGPLGLAAVSAPLTADQINFSLNPEILVARYSVDKQPADMILVMYPTPQIAGDRLRAIETAGPSPDGTTVVAKRAGPIVAVVKGMLSERDARRIIGRVNYEADVTWNENTGLSKRDNIGNLIVAAFMLVGIILLISLGTGVLFGFSRVILQRLFPNRFLTKDEGDDFIRLNLKGEGTRSK